MVIGNGLIAKSFSSFESDDRYIIFASGVSNSSSTNELDYLREFELLRGLISSEKILVYFSTCSLFDSNLYHSRYVLHKKNIEEFISINFKKYLILRLPTVVGESGNPNTFFNFFYNKLLNNENVDVFLNSNRYLIDANDLTKIFNLLIMKNRLNEVLNVAFNNSEKVFNIVLYIKHVLNSDSQINQIDKGSYINIPNQEFLKLINDNEIINFNVNYQSILSKYIKLKKINRSDFKS